MLQADATLDADLSSNTRRHGTSLTVTAITHFRVRLAPARGGGARHDGAERKPCLLYVQHVQSARPRSNGSRVRLDMLGMGAGIFSRNESVPCPGHTGP